MKSYRWLAIALMITATILIVVKRPQRNVDQSNSASAPSACEKPQNTRKSNRLGQGDTENFAMHQWQASVPETTQITVCPTSLQLAENISAYDVEKLFDEYQQENSTEKKMDLITMLSRKTKDEKFATLFGPIIQQDPHDTILSDTLWSLLNERPMVVKIPILAYLCNAKGHSMQTLAYDELYEIFDAPPASGKSDLFQQISQYLQHENTN
jgi:hypothetical protein